MKTPSYKIRRRASVRKDERGLSQIIVIAIVAAVIAAAGYAGWRVMENNKTPAAAKTTAGKAVSDACQKVYNDKQLCDAAAVNADFDKLAYTAVATSTDAEGQTAKLTLQSDGKGNSSFTTAAGGQEFSTVTIGKTVYTKTAGIDTWTKYTDESSTPTVTNPSSELKTQFSDSSTPADKRIQYKKIGKEKCGNDTCLKYQVTDPATPGTTSYIWVNTNTYRMQRFYTKDANGTSDFVITYGAVKISEPSPVAEAPAASASGMSQAEIDAALQQAQAAAAQYAQ